MRDYKDITTHRKRSVLPEALQLSIAQLRDSLREGRVAPANVAAVVSGLSRLPAGVYLRAGREVADIGGLHYWYAPKRSIFSFILGLVRPRKPMHELLQETPGLEYLFIFHGDGRLREAALAKIDGPIGSAFFLSSIAYRLNDWAEPVRRAAQACAARTFPKTSPEIIAETAFALLEHARHWQRRDKGETILEEAFARPDVTRCLAMRIAAANTGSPGRVRKQAMRNDRMDEHLLYLFREAAQPTVRALALKTLVEGRALWPEGFARQWVDKSMGLSRHVVTHGERQLNRPSPVELLIAQGAADKAAMVRRAAADGLVQHRHALRNLDEMVQKFAIDKSESVRERAIFILQERKK